MADFVSEHPDILERYKNIAGAKGALEPEEMESNFDERSYADALIAELARIPGGSADATRYHKYCIGALTFLFYPEIITPIKEREIDQGRKRVDITYKNAATSGFFHSALQSAQMRALEVQVECKNYSQDVANPELDQITGRFSHVRGFLGLLCCRSFDNKERFIDRCKDAAVHRSHYVIVLDDNDLRAMLQNVSDGNRRGNDAFLRQRHSQLLN